MHADGKTVLFAIWVGNVRKSELAATSLDDGKVTPLGIADVIPLGATTNRSFGSAIC